MAVLTLRSLKYETYFCVILPLILHTVIQYYFKFFISPNLLYVCKEETKEKTLKGVSKRLAKQCL